MLLGLVRNCTYILELRSLPVPKMVPKVAPKKRFWSPVLRAGLLRIALFVWLILVLFRTLRADLPDLFWGLSYTPYELGYIVGMRRKRSSN